MQFASLGVQSAVRGLSLITCISFPLCQLFGHHFEINFSIVSELSEREKHVESIYPSEKIPIGSTEKPPQSTMT